MKSKERRVNLQMAWLYGKTFIVLYLLSQHFWMWSVLYRGFIRVRISQLTTIFSYARKIVFKILSRNWDNIFGS